MDVNLFIAALFGAGGTGFIAAIWQVVRSYRSDKAVSEGTLIQRLDTRLKDAEHRCDRLADERNTAREQAVRYRLLAIDKGATIDELNRARDG